MCFIYIKIIIQQSEFSCKLSVISYNNTIKNRLFFFYLRYFICISFNKNFPDKITFSFIKAGQHSILIRNIFQKVSLTQRIEKIIDHLITLLIHNSGNYFWHDIYTWHFHHYLMLKHIILFFYILIHMIEHPEHHVTVITPVIKRRNF